VSTADPPKATPTAPPAADDEAPLSSQHPGSDPLPASMPGPAASAPGNPPPSTPAPAPSPAPDSAPTPAAPDSPPPSPASTPPASGASPSSSPPEPTDENDDCAEIPTAAHVVLTAEIKFAVQIPYSMDQASHLPHKFTLGNEDGSYSKTVTVASDCQASGPDGPCLLSFTDLVEDHTYTLQCDDGNSTYSIFDKVPYDQLVAQLADRASADENDSAPASSPSVVDPAEDAAPQSES
jgi:hypothetical protein